VTITYATAAPAETMTRFAISREVGLVTRPSSAAIRRGRSNR
jgi:hypothetical protein